MPAYVSVGAVPRKEHARADGRFGRLVEELVGQSGFAGASSLLYHERSPSALVAAEAVTIDREPFEPNRALVPLHFRLGTLGAAGDLVLGRTPLLGNSDVAVTWAHAAGSSPLYRNAMGDELVFIFSGAAVLESVFGPLSAAAGDYVVVPASTTHRWVTEGEVEALIFEVSGHVRFPENYVGDSGRFLEGAPFGERDLRSPTAPLLAGGTDVEVLIHHRNGWARHVYATHPFDVVGWDGNVYPYALSIADFEPIVGRFHQPPPVHRTFVGQGVVICSFVPRLLDFDPMAVPTPYHHANVDSDEVLFYVDGNFTSRTGAGITRGSLTLHPAGFVHGPHPGAVESALGAERTDETAVMLDTVQPLGTTAIARSVADGAYLRSWLTPSTTAR